MDSHIPCVCRLIFIKMLKHLLILGLFLPTLFCRFIFQDSNNSNGNARSSILENNFLDVERELSMASEIAGILENRRLSRVRVRHLKSLTCIFIFIASLLFRVWTALDQDLGMAREPWVSQTTWTFWGRDSWDKLPRTDQRSR